MQTEREVTKMKKPRFTREELNCLEAGHEVEKGSSRTQSTGRERSR